VYGPSLKGSTLNERRKQGQQKVYYVYYVLNVLYCVAQLCIWYDMVQADGTTWHHCSFYFK